MSRNFARFVGQFEIQNPIILDRLKFSVPLVVTFPVVLLDVLLNVSHVDGKAPDEVVGVDGVTNLRTRGMAY